MYMFEERDFSKGLTLSPLDVIYYFVISVSISVALGRVNFTCSDLDVSRTCKSQSAPDIENLQFTGFIWTPRTFSSQ